MNLTEVKDVTKLQSMVLDLWTLLDDIDTLDDMCKNNNEAFRKLTRDLQQKRHKVLTSDGYNLLIPDLSS
jgi:hypothetical protein